MTEAFTLPLLTAILGAVAGAVLTSFFISRHNKRTLAIEFHKEWNSYEMSVHRRKAYHCIKKYPDINYDELTGVDEDGSISVFIILRFFERLGQCFQSNSLNRQLAATLFYESFYWWYFVSFNTSLRTVKDGWKSFEVIEELKTQMREYTRELDYCELSKKYTQKYLHYVSNKRASDFTRQVS
jgi:hypothetical protein